MHVYVYVCMHICMYMYMYMCAHKGHTFQCMCMHTSSQPGRSLTVSCQLARSDVLSRRGLSRALPLLLSASATV